MKDSPLPEYGAQRRHLEVLTAYAAERMFPGSVPKAYADQIAHELRAVLHRPGTP